MKKSYLLLMLPLLITACKPKPAATADAAKTDSVAYPYTIKHPDQWQIDTSKANTVAALNLLKAVVSGDTASVRKLMADSVEVNYDHGAYKGAIKPLLVILKNEADSTKTNLIKMQDWEAVTSKVNTDQWVTTWYKQTWTNLEGKTDSAEFVDDALFKNGKIIKVEEYERHYPKKKM